MMPTEDPRVDSMSNRLIRIRLQCDMHKITFGKVSGGSQSITNPNTHILKLGAQDTLSGMLFIWIYFGISEKRSDALFLHFFGFWDFSPKPPSEVTPHIAALYAGLLA